MKEIYTKVAIVGGGPAGCAAAIQIRRAGIDTIIFEKNQIGGLVRNANWIENYLGISQGINGEKFAQLMEEQITSLVINTIFEEVQEIEFKDSFILKTETITCKADYLILATGTIPIKPKIKGLQEAEKYGLVFCEPMNIPEKLASNKRIGIIGGGDAAFDYALNLVQKNNGIIIVHRNETFSCLPLLYHRVSNISEIKVLTSIIVEEIQITKDNNIELLMQNHSPIKIDLLLIAVGRKPNDLLYNNLSKEILEENNKLFLVGDLNNDKKRQISIATGDALRSAMEIITRINTEFKG